MEFKGFVALDMNDIIVNKELSSDSVRFIAVMRHLLKTKKDNFVISKKLVLEICNFGERKYRKVMKESKDYIKLTRKRIKSTWSYTYELLKETFTKTNKQAEAIEKEEIIEDTLTVNTPVCPTVSNEHPKENISTDIELDDKLTLVKACINPIHMISKETINLLKKVAYYDLVSLLEPIFLKNKFEYNKVSIKYLENTLKIFLNNNNIR